MVFWTLILLISILTVIAVGLPILRRQAPQVEENDKGKTSNRHYVLLGVLAVSPIIAASIYLNVGAPDSLTAAFVTQPAQQPNSTDTIADLPPEDRAAMIENMVSGLAARLQEDPSNPDDWRMLARSYGALGRSAESVDAFREVVSRDPNAGPDDWRNYATAMLSDRGPGPGAYSEDFRGALNKLREFNEDDPLALFYLGLVARDQGEAAAALVHWRRLDEIIPEDAPIREQLRSMIAELEGAAE